MIIKVCGIKTKENISFLSKANIDMIGLNFYRPSIRFVSDQIDPLSFDDFAPNVKRVGVFVNENQNTILEISKRFKLDYLQLHGDEDPNYCNVLAQQIPIIKVFRVDENFDMTKTNQFHSASYLLFDTQTKHYGGSGLKFNWTILNDYEGSIPFLLSGGIGPEDHAQILQINHPQFAGIDINSKFESKPGVKDRNMLLPFIAHLKSR